MHLSQFFRKLGKLPRFDQLGCFRGTEEEKQVRACLLKSQMMKLTTQKTTIARRQRAPEGYQESALLDWASAVQVFCSSSCFFQNST